MFAPQSLKTPCDCGVNIIQTGLFRPSSYKILSGFHDSVSQLFQCFPALCI